MTEEDLLNWVNSFLLKKNNLEKRGVWTERDYYIDGKGYYVGEDWIYIDGVRAELHSIEPLKDFINKK